MLHDVIVLVHFFNFFIKITNKHYFFSSKCSAEGNFDIDAGDGGRGGDHLGPQIPKHHKKSQKYFVRELFTLLGHFSKMSKISNNVFKICSYIQKKTQNPIIASKITIYNTKYANNAKIHLKTIQTFRKIKNPYFRKIRFQNDQRFMLKFMALFITLYILYVLYIYIYFF